MKGTHIFVIVAVIALIGANFGIAALWAVAAVSTIALIVLIVAMRRQGDYRSPRILVDDARERFDWMSDRRRREDEIYDSEPSREDGK